VGPTRLVYFDDMWALRSAATVLAVHQVSPPSLFSCAVQEEYEITAIDSKSKP
jgi:hypothetical protein